MVVQSTVNLYKTTSSIISNATPEHDTILAHGSRGVEVVRLVFGTIFSPHNSPAITFPQRNTHFVREDDLFLILQHSSCPYTTCPPQPSLSNYVRRVELSFSNSST